MQQILDEIARHINEQRKITGMLAQEIANIKAKIADLEERTNGELSCGPPKARQEKSGKIFHQ
jgi:hypothetical protein